MTIHTTARPASIARWKKILIAAAVLLLLLLLVIWWRLWQGGVHLGPLQLNSSAIVSTDSTHFGGFWSSAESAYVPTNIATRRIWIVPQGQGQLLDKIAAAVKARLEEDPSIRQVRLGSQWPEGQVPDVMIHLRLDSLDEHDGLISRHLKVSVPTSMATGPAGMMAPLVSADYSGTLEHDSRSTGDGIGVDRYRLTSAHIADKLAEAIRKQLDEWRDKNGELPDLPAALYPPYRPTSEVDFLKDFQARQTVGGSALLSRNESLYTFEDSRDPSLVFCLLASAIQGAGWTLRGDVKDSINAAWDTRTLSVLPQRATAYATGSMPLGGAKPLVYEVHYSDPMTDPERAALWDELVRAGQWRQAAPYLEGSLKGPARAAYLQRLAAAPDKSSREYLLLSDESGDAGDHTPAADWLTRAAAMARFEQRTDWLKNGTIRDRAKSLGDEKLIDDPPTEQTLRDMGLPELPPASAALLEKTLPSGQRLCAFAGDASGRLHLVSAAVTPDLRLGLWDIDAGSASSAWTTTGGAPPGAAAWHADAYCSAGLNGPPVLLEAHATQVGPDRFRITLGQRK